MTTSRLKSILAAFALVGASSIALARGPVDHLSERLNLSAEQESTIAALFEEHRDYMHNEIQWRNADGDPDPAARERASAAREALHQEIVAVLDAEQTARFEQMRERRERRGPRGPSGDRMAYAFGQLDLSTEQEEAVRNLMAEFRAERMHNRGEFRSRLASILSEEQLAQLEEMRDAHRGRRR